MTNTKKDRPLFELPDQSNPDKSKKIVGTTAKKSRPRSKPKAALPESLQPFLPGLSRRGRPRSKNPLPATVRASESRKRRLEAGMKRVELLLTAEITADLERLCLYYRVPRIEIISRLIAKAAKRLPAA
ncbi:MAG: hypothetical protein QMD73_09600 [Rhodocyclaceae bacterium]|nr:hypothetical protein [Rhodocyclaceae bacterium]